MNILDEIVEKHKKDLEERGISMGYDIPEERIRPVVPFLPTKGVILEVKRASPSKGDIAPNLDSAQTALSYVDAGAAAISCLTEEHWFKGGLNDLMKVTSAVGTKAAVLRKDFLVYEDEIDVAYKCGADAVLLIARILDDEKIVAMAKRAETLGLTSLVELKIEDDLRKLKLVSDSVNHKYVVCGVNARDLKNFAINLLTPSGIFSEIQKIMGDDARVVFESGIRTPQAADFAGSLGFTGMLLGEAAARNPGEAKALVQSFINAKETPHSNFWNKMALELHDKNLSSIHGRRKPLVKICGITCSEDLNQSVELGADFLGFIFCGKSLRNVRQNQLNLLKSDILSVRKMKNVKTIAVITETDSEEAKLALSYLSGNTLSNEPLFDAVQVHGYETAISFLSDENLRRLPHYCAVPIRTLEDLEKLEELRKLGEPRILVDAKVEGLLGGTGIKVDQNLVDIIRKKQKLWLAGGINPDNVIEVIINSEPELIDLSSGLESSPGKKDCDKMNKLFLELSKLEETK
ncbi:MAG: bifunctional indole-3-glycerol phosphate synthase/phosphoribosylanthranilate isomerase [Treponema sp.]|nr:bifunctional indole-3-glycerol phosphate synthase/phosphoribosylanthranilate isomerase [Treponema sp.]